MRFLNRFARGEFAPHPDRGESPPTQRHGSPPAAAVTAASHPVRLQRLVGLAAIVLITALAYLPIFRGGFIWDDETWITDNRLLRTLGGLRAIWLEPGRSPQYYPLTQTTLWLEYHLWGPRPLGYHLVNVALHALNAGLVWLTLAGSRSPGRGWRRRCSRSIRCTWNRSPGRRS